MIDMITVKNIIDEDFTNYKECAMFIGFPHCTFKCEKECGLKICQNSSLATSLNIEVEIRSVVERYVSNPLSHSIVVGGLEPFDDWCQLKELVEAFRKETSDTIVIYTGYNKDEISVEISELKNFGNIIVKFGRFIPNQEKHFDSVLGVFLASGNQYAEVI